MLRNSWDHVFASSTCPCQKERVWAGGEGQPRDTAFKSEERVGSTDTVLGLIHSKAVCLLPPANTMLSGPLPSWSCSLLPLESLGSLGYPPSQRGQPRGPLCSPVTLPLCLSQIQGMAENWPLTDKLGSWECFLIFFLFPSESLRRKSGSKTQTFKLQAASQSLRLLSDHEH